MNDNYLMKLMIYIVVNYEVSHDIHCGKLCGQLIRNYESTKLAALPPSLSRSLSKGLYRWLHMDE